MVLDGLFLFLANAINSLIGNNKTRGWVIVDKAAAAAAFVPKFAMCAVPSMVSFGSRSFSWPISGSSRDSLEPWDITKHLVHAILKAASGQDRLKSRTWKQRIGIDKICISLLNTVCNCGLLWKSPCLKSSEQQKSAAFHPCLGDFVSEAKHNDNSGSWKLCLNSSPISGTRCMFRCVMLCELFCWLANQFGQNLAACEQRREKTASAPARPCRRTWVFLVIQTCAIIGYKPITGTIICLSRKEKCS